MERDQTGRPGTRSDHIIQAGKQEASTHLDKGSVCPLKRRSDPRHSLSQAAHCRPQLLQLLLELLGTILTRSCWLLTEVPLSCLQPQPAPDHCCLQVGTRRRGRRRQRRLARGGQQRAGVDCRQRLLQLDQRALAVPAASMSATSQVVQCRNQQRRPNG